MYLFKKLLEPAGLKNIQKIQSIHQPTSVHFENFENVLVSENTLRLYQKRDGVSG